MKKSFQNLQIVHLMLKLISSTLVILFLITSVSLAQSPNQAREAIAAANELYESGQFGQAVAGYEAVIAEGLFSSDLYYNLGNAYFKQGDLGRAILNYRRAQRLDPRDSDIAVNLNVARNQTVDQLEDVGSGTFTNLVRWVEEWLTLNEAAILALFLWFLLNFLVILAIVLPRLRRFFGIVIAVVGLFLVAGLISIGNRFYIEWQYSPAVVIAPIVEVTSGPGTANQYLTEFELHAGAEVSLIESRPGWRRITLPGDLQGWVPVEAVEPVLAN